MLLLKSSEVWSHVWQAFSNVNCYVTISLIQGRQTLTQTLKKNIETTYFSPEMVIFSCYGYGIHNN